MERRKRSEVAGKVTTVHPSPSMPDETRNLREDAEMAAAIREREVAEQEAGERAFAEAAGGEVVEVTWGAELYQPIPYNGNTVGPFKVTGRTLPGETVAQALVRIHREVAGAARVVRAEKFREYLEELAKFVRDANAPRM